MSLSSARVPLAIASGLVCLVIGLGGGAAAMMVLGYNLKGPPPQDANSDPIPMAMMNPAAKGGGGMGKGGGGMGKAAGPGEGRGPSSKAQLAALVTKLDQLTQKPLTVALTAEQKKSAHEALKGLADANELSDEEAKKRLDQMLELLKDQKDTLKAAGYLWPGDQFPQASNAPNPFKNGEAGKHLKSLDGVLTK